MRLWYKGKSYPGALHPFFYACLPVSSRLFFMKGEKMINLPNVLYRRKKVSVQPPDDDDDLPPDPPPKQPKKIKKLPQQYEILTSGECDACVGGIFPAGEAPEPPFHPNCRCEIIPFEASADVPDEEIQNLSNEQEKLVSRLADFLKDFEGAETSPYIDTKGKITIGIGNNINNEKDFVNTPFKTIGGQPLTAKEKEALFQELSEARDLAIAVKGTPGKQIVFNFSADNQRSDPLLSRFKDVMVDAEYVQQEAERYLAREMPILKAKMRTEGIDFDSLPEGAKLAVMDMQYNLGNPNFDSEPSHWPKFFSYLRNGDYINAAQQSERGDVQDKRNEQIKQWLIEAAIDSRY